MAKKRPSKAAKAAKKILESSKLLAEKTDRDMRSGQEFKSSEAPARENNLAMKARPHKKRG